MNDPDSVMLNQLLQCAKDGDPKALNQLCQEIQVRLRPILKHRLWEWDSNSLEDILQNTMVVFVEKLMQIENNPHFFAISVLRFKIGDALKSKKKQRKTTESLDSIESEEEPIGKGQLMSLADPDSDFTVPQEIRFMTEQIRSAILKLGKFCKTFFVAMLEERTVSEVWDLFQKLEPGLKRSAFDKRIFDCRRRLKTIIEAES
jgi:DNA-directed RNA polymerase specialized sigma24 family protein